MEEIKFKVIKNTEEKTEIKSKPTEKNVIVNFLEFEKLPPVPTVLKTDKYASAEWKRAIKELIKKNMINQLDLKPLEVLCKSYSRWRKLEEKIDTLESFTYKPYEDSKIEHPRPEIKIAQTYAKQYTVLCESFGMTPTSRLAMIKGSEFRTPKGDSPKDDSPKDVTEIILGG